MNKKVLIILVAALVIILLVGFFVSKYLNQIKATETQNSLGGASIDNSRGDGFTVCADKCGDGVCQKADPSCKDKLNCPCPETPQDCPQDCK